MARDRMVSHRAADLSHLLEMAGIPNRVVKTTQGTVEIAFNDPTDAQDAVTEIKRSTIHDAGTIADTYILVYVRYPR